MPDPTPVDKDGSHGAAETPLHELLAAIPKDARLEWQDKDGLRAYHLCPIGILAHRAAEALARQAPEPAAGPYATQADAWNDALEKSAQIVERYNAADPDPVSGGAPDDIRALKQLPRPTNPPRPTTDRERA